MKEESQKNRFNFSNWIYRFFVIGIILFFLFESNFKTISETTWSEFKKDMLLNNDVEKIVIINKERVEVYLKQSSLIKPKYYSVSKNIFGNINNGPHYAFTIGSVDVLEKQIEETQKGVSEKNKIKINYVTQGKSIWNTILSWVLPILIIVLIWNFILKNTTSISGGITKSIFDFGKSNPQIFDSKKNKQTTFKDVAGYEEAKVEVMEIVEFLKQPEKFIKLGAKIPKGILLIGEPGTGKTLMAKAIAGEAEVPFFSLSGSEFIELFVGIGASRVRDLFNKAKQQAPSIIFIDEIDSIGRVRGKALAIQSNDERDSTLNQLLAEMDGFDPNTGVIVLAATNREDILDPALIRAGRFDRHIYLDLPNKQERIAIFNVHLKPLLLHDKINVEILSSQTVGFSGADIANVCNEAALIAARLKKDYVEEKDFYTAIDRIICGIEKKSKILLGYEKEIIAYHEAGHTIVSWMLKNVDPILKTSIIPRGQSLGGSWYIADEKQIITYSQFFDNLSAGLGGRVAEEIIFNESSSGALDDLEKVTKQAYAMIAQFGLNNKLGSVSYYDSTADYDYYFQKSYSEETAQIIDQEVRKLISKAHQQAKIILQNNLDKLNALAKQLIEKEIIYQDEIEKILGKRAE